MAQGALFSRVKFLETYIGHRSAVFWRKIITVVLLRVENREHAKPSQVGAGRSGPKHVTSNLKLKLIYVHYDAQSGTPCTHWGRFT